MTSRERVWAAISHQPPDRAPVDLNVTMAAYEKLKAHLGLRLNDDPAPNMAMEVIPHPAALVRMGVDLISVKLDGFQRRAATLPELVTDAWGITRRLVRQALGEYYEATSHPLAGAGLTDLNDYPWPDPQPVLQAQALRDYAQELYRNTDLALVGRFGGPILELASELLGMEEWMIRLVTDQEFTVALLDRITDICTSHDLLGLEAAGEFLSIMKVSGEDLGMQRAPLYSMRTFREILLPTLRRRWSAVRERLSKVNGTAKIMLHSCGAIRPFIPEMMAAGIEILDPIQPRAQGMQPEELYAEFSAKLVFHGGIDVQQLLPYGAAEEVACETRRYLAALRASRGGYIVAPSHTVQADVPPENIVAMIKATQDGAGYSMNLV